MSGGWLRPFAGLRVTNRGVRPYAGVALNVAKVIRAASTPRRAPAPAPRRLHEDLPDLGELEVGSAVLVCGRPWSVLRLDRNETVAGQQVVVTLIPGRS